MNTRVSKMVAIANTMSNAEKIQWLNDIEREYGRNSEQFKIVEIAIGVTIPIASVPK